MAEVHLANVRCTVLRLRKRNRGSKRFVSVSQACWMKSRSVPAGCEIYLGDIYDPTDGVGDAPSVFLPHWPDGLAIHAKYNLVIRDVASAREHVHVVPLHETFLGHG